MFSTGGGVGSSTDVKVSSFFTAGESGVTTTVNGGASGLGIIHASYNGVSSGGIEKFNTRIDKGSNVAIQAYITQKQWILMAFNDLLRIAWRGDWRREPLWAGNALDPTNNVDIAAGLGSSTAYLLFDFDRTARMYLRRFRRSAEGYFFHCDSVQYFYKKTGSGAYELTSRPHMTNDGLVWIDGNRWQLGHYNLANPLIYFQSAPVCLLNSPADGATTGTKPVLQFTGTDQDGDDITYEVQISNNNTFIDTPDKISGLKAWWKADSLGLTDGTAVSSWGDSSASGIALTQATSANQPIFKTNILNGNPVVRFDGIDDRLRAASTLGLSQPNTIFIVVGNWNSSTAGNLVDVATGDGARQLVAYDTGVALGFYAGTGFVSDAPATHPGYICISALFNGASSTINVNGTQVLTGNPGSNGLGQPTIGSDGGNAFGGDIAEIIVFNRALTAAERANVENYLGNKYGIQTSGTSAPFFDKFSATDTGFTNTISGGDLDPFTQNNQIAYAVSSGVLTAGNTYYWRVRGKDPAGSNSWGDWAVTRSFTATSGATPVTLTATLSFTGALSRRPTKVFSPTLSFAGAIIKAVRDAGFTATLSFVGNLASSKLFSRAFTATLSFAGAISRGTGKAFTPTLSFAGGLNRKIIDSGFAATLSSAGNLTRRFLDSGFTATLSFVGNLAASKLFARAFTATLSFAGALSRRTGKSLTAALSFVTAQTKRVVDAGFTATLSFTGSFAKAVGKKLSAGLSFIGNLGTSFIAGGGHLFTQAFTATLSTSAALSLRTSKVFAATLSFAAALIKKITDAGFFATLSFTGSLVERLLDAGFTATLSFVGNLAVSKSFIRAFTASLSFVGNLAVSKSFLKAFTATFSTSASLVKSTGKKFSATLSTLASLTRRISRSFTASLSFVGSVVKAIRDAGILGDAYQFQTCSEAVHRRAFIQWDDPAFHSQKSLGHALIFHGSR